MQRGGPRSTIPPPSEQRPAVPRWPLQVLLGVGVVGAVFLGLRLLRNEPTVARSPADSTTRSRGDIAQGRDQRASSAAPSASRIPEAPLGLEAFVAQLRR